MIDHHGAWLPSIWIGIPALAVTLGLLLGLIFLAWKKGDDTFDRWLSASLPIFSALVLVIASLFGYWPYKGDYHRLQPISGVVASVDTRFLSASQYVVVSYQNGETVRCDDSRCATVRPGQTLRLLCTKEFQYGTVNGWGCNWGQG